MTSRESTDVCLWMVRPFKGGVRRVRLSRKFLIQIALIIGLSVGGLALLANDYVQVLWERGDTVYKLAKLISEREKLQKEKTKLLNQVALLREETAKSTAFQESVASKMNELYAVIESSTALGLLHGGGRETKPHEVEPEELVTVPEVRLASRERPELGKKLREINKALGGAEIECRKDRATGSVSCISPSQKRNVSVEEVRGSLRPAVIKASAEEWADDREGLLARLKRYVEVIKSVPLGAPSKGTVTSGFGPRISPFSARQSFHEGMDISLPQGEKVLVTGDGVVSRVEFDGTYGWMIDVDHWDGVVSRYAHLKRALVEQGQVLTRGDLIALSGSTGRSTGPHLHYEVLVDGKPHNPARFVQLASKLRRIL